MRRTGGGDRWYWILCVGIAIALIAVPPILSKWIVFLLTIALAKGMVVLGVVFLLRAGLISFGHGFFFAAGAYTAAFAIHHLHIHEAAALLAMCVVSGGALAAVVGLLLRRYRGIFFAMLSLAFSMILYTLLLKFYTITGGTDGLSVPPVSILGLRPQGTLLRIGHYYFVLAISTGVAFLGWRFLSSPLGYLLKAVRDNEIRVEYMGTSANRAIYVSFVLSGALGGLGGGLVAFNVEHVAPEMAYWTTCADFVFVSVFGGTGSVFAPFMGSIFYEFIRNYAFKLSPETWQMTLGGILLLIIFFLPQGLWSLSDTIRRKRRQWQLSSK